MKHLKLLGLLMAVMTAVFSYGQAGTGVIRVNDNLSQTTISAHTDASSPFGSSFMIGSGFIAGMARGVQVIHASVPVDSNFGLFDPTDSVSGGISVGMGADGSFIVTTVKEMDFYVDSTNNFFIGVVYAGPVGTFSDMVTLAGNGATVGVNFMAVNADGGGETPPLFLNRS